MLILGLNAFHADSAACVVRDGQLVAAAEEERFRRVKHFPSEAIKWCLREAGEKLADVTHLSVNQDNSANNWQRAAFLCLTPLFEHDGELRFRLDPLAGRPFPIRGCVIEN